MSETKKQKPKKGGMERTSCRVCGNGLLAPIMSLGDIYVSDFVDDNSNGTKAPLDLVLCSVKDGGCGLLQLKHTVSHEAMYRNYWYRSGMNRTMTDELRGIAAKVESMADLKPGDYVVDIGANDGTLLRGYAQNDIKRIGYEPAKNLDQYNRVGTTRVFRDFFNHAVWKDAFGDRKAKGITAIAMFYDLEDPNAFVADVAKTLDEEGIFIIQMSYLPLMLGTNEVGNICHEHLEYYSLLSMENLLARHGLEVVDVELNDINGGSFRLYMRHKGKGKKLAVPIGADIRVAALREYEKKLGLDDKKAYQEFALRVEGIKRELTAFVKAETAKEKKIYIYGASTKGNTVLQYFGLDHSLLHAAAERNSDKWGKKTVGTLIPIISEEEARAASPHYFLVLPWHFMKEFMEREKEFLARGGKFIVPFPELKIVGLDEGE